MMSEEKEQKPGNHDGVERRVAERRKEPEPYTGPERRKHERREYD